MTVLEVNDILDGMSDVPGFDFGLVNFSSANVIREAYNGCGPEDWSQSLRDRLAERTQMFAPAILVHDLDFYESDGDEDRMHEANERFHRNTRVIFRHFYPLFTWRILKPSYRLKRAKAYAIMTALNIATTDAFTRKTWRECHEAKEARNNDGQQHC